MATGRRPVANRRRLSSTRRHLTPVPARTVEETRSKARTAVRETPRDGFETPLGGHRTLVGVPVTPPRATCEHPDRSIHRPGAETTNAIGA